MHTSDSGVEFIISLEGISLKAYKLSGEKYYTIGVGHYGPDVKAGQTITREKAVSILKKDLKRFETAVQTIVTDIKLTQNRFDALVSYTFNRGEGGLRQLASHSSTPEQYAANMVKYWGSATRYRSALIARRKKEAALFKKADKTTTKKSSTTKPAASTEDAKTKCIKKGQKYANTFADCELKVTGTRTAVTKMAAVRVVQHALNLDYHAGLVEDGDWNMMTEEAFGAHYVKKGEKQYMVTALEILLLLKGYDTKGVEIPGEFGAGLEAALVKFNGKKVAKISTFKALCK